MRPSPTPPVPSAAASRQHRPSSLRCRVLISRRGASGRFLVYSGTVPSSVLQDAAPGIETHLRVTAYHQVRGIHQPPAMPRVSGQPPALPVLSTRRLKRADPAQIPVQLAARNAFALAHILDRIVVLPRLLCYCDMYWGSPTVPECVTWGADLALPFECPADNLFNLPFWEWAKVDHGPHRLRLPWSNASAPRRAAKDVRRRSYSSCADAAAACLPGAMA